MKKITAIGIFVLVLIAVIYLVTQKSNVIGHANAGMEKVQVVEEQNEDHEGAVRDETKKAEDSARIERLKMAARLSMNEREDPPEKPPISPGQVQQAVDSVEKILKEGKRDTEWEGQVTSAAKDALERAQVEGVGVYKTRCSGSVCGVDLKCDSMDAFKTLAETKLDGPWSKSEAFATASTIDDQIGMKIYFSKEGTDLPVDEDMVLPPM